MEQEKVTLLGVSFDNKIKKLLKNYCSGFKRRKKFVVTANPEIVMYAKKSKLYEYHKKANYIAADGIGNIKGAKIIQTPIVERIAGYELMLNSLNKTNQHKLKVSFLVATEKVSVKTIKK